MVPVGIAGMQDKDGVVARWMSRNACLAAIVRPDHYVYGVATTPEQLSRLLQALQTFIETGDKHATPQLS